eukprot:5093852-Prymnesium_polylepis.1
MAKTANMARAAQLGSTWTGPPTHVSAAPPLLLLSLSWQKCSRSHLVVGGGKDGSGYQGTNYQTSSDLTDRDATRELHRIRTADGRFVG